MPRRQKKRLVIACAWAMAAATSCDWATAGDLKLAPRQASTRVVNPEINLPVCIPLIGGEFVEARGLALVLRQAAAAVLVVDPKVELSTGVTLVGRLAKPAHRSSIVLRDAPAVGVQDAEVELSG